MPATASTVNVDGTFQVRQVLLELRDSQALLVHMDIQEFGVLLDHRDLGVLSVHLDHQEVQALQELLEL